MEFRPLVVKHLYNMLNDHYLVRFLRARKLNVRETKDMLLDSMIWRKQNKIDTALEQTFEIEKAMPYDLTLDRLGRPVGSIRVGEWKIRRWLLAGKHDEVLRAVYKIVELAMLKIREASVVSGKNITQGLGIADLNGFTIREHTCLRCLQLYLEMLTQYEKNYPQVVYRIISINVPRIFQSVYEVLKPVLSEYTVSTLSINTYDKNEWRRELLKYVDNNQLPTYFGGTYLGNKKP